MTKELYLFSGLGADKRVFQFLELDNYKKIFIEWIPPLENEKIESYARRISEQIKTEKPILIGLSFGGLIAIEIAKQIETEKVILISSAKTRSELPFSFRLGGLLGLGKMLPMKFMKKANIITCWFFGAQTPNEKQLLKKILDDTESTFLKWAMPEIMSWTNQTRIENLKHIHGTKDRILPFRFVKADIIIEGGGHFMILNRAKEVTMALKEFLDH